MQHAMKIQNVSEFAKPKSQPNSQPPIKKCASSSFNKPPRLLYHHISDASVICSFPFFASPEICEELILLCEMEGFHSEKEESTYTQATFDLEVDSNPRVRDWLVTHELVPEISACMQRSHATSLVSFDDVFVVKYDASVPGGQQSLEWHYDAAELSFMLALSDRDSYIGGGTAFDVLQDEYDKDKQSEALEGLEGAAGLADYFRGTAAGSTLRPLHLQQGELLIFDANLYHSGLAVSSGVRYLLVGFCFVAGGEEGGAAAARGELDLNLLPLS